MAKISGSAVPLRFAVSIDSPDRKLRPVFHRHMAPRQIFLGKQGVRRRDQGQGIPLRSPGYQNGSHPGSSGSGSQSTALHGGIHRQ